VEQPNNVDVGLEELLVELRQDERFQRLVRIAEEDNDAWATNFAQGVLRNSGPVLQREIDYKRGWYEASMYYLKARPEIAVKRLRKHHQGGE
jgi:hypothetical protein